MGDGSLRGMDDDDVAKEEEKANGAVAVYGTNIRLWTA